MPMNPRLLRPLAKVQASDPWLPVLSSAYAADITSAYDFREIAGSALAGRVGPLLNLQGVLATADGGAFDPNDLSQAFAQDAIFFEPDHTVLFVAKSDMISISEAMHWGVTEDFGYTPMAVMFSREFQSLMPYNGNDNQQTTYLSDGLEWFYAAASFSGDGTVRYAIRASSGNLNGTLIGEAHFFAQPGYPNSGFWFGGNYSILGTMRLGMTINRAFTTEADMNSLFATIQSGPAADIL